MFSKDFPLLLNREGNLLFSLEFFKYLGITVFKVTMPYFQGEGTTAKAPSLSFSWGETLVSLHFDGLWELTTTPFLKSVITTLDKHLEIYLKHHHFTFIT